MLKKRIIPKFLIREGRLVKGMQFNTNIREAGNPVSTAKVYDAYGVDELILLDIDATAEKRGPNFKILQKISEEIFMPFTIGGGIASLDMIYKLLRNGADKVSITTAAVDNPSFVREAAGKFGNSCIVVGIDYLTNQHGVARVVTNGGRRIRDIDPLEHALRMQDNNAGELLLCSIDRDGCMVGYDTDFLEEVSEKLDIPVIASSGAGSLADCQAAFRTGVSAITVSSMFLFTDHSPIKLRTYLSTNGVNVRSQKGSFS